MLVSASVGLVIMFACLSCLCVVFAARCPDNVETQAMTETQAEVPGLPDLWSLYNGHVLVRKSLHASVQDALSSLRSKLIEQASLLQRVSK